MKDGWGGVLIWGRLKTMCTRPSLMKNGWEARPGAAAPQHSWLRTRRGLVLLITYQMHIAEPRKFIHFQRAATKMLPARSPLESPHWVPFGESLPYAAFSGESIGSHSRMMSRGTEETEISAA